MSVHALSCILGTGSEEGRSRSDGYARLVFLGVANRADDHGFAWPKIRDLAKAAKVHRSTVNRRLDELITAGELRMFTRGHYQSPAFVMTIVDHPLSSQQIAERLVELDPRAEWRERVIDPAGEVAEVAVPVQQSLAERSSQSATISENDTTVSIDPDQQAADQGKQPDRGREKARSAGPGEIVAERDNLREIVADSDEIVADGNEIVAVARRSSEPSENRQRTTTADADPDGGGGWEDDPEEIARRWCDLTGRRFVGKIAEIYPRQVARFLAEHPPPSDEFLARAHGEGIKHPSGWMFVSGAAGDINSGRQLPDCDRCGNHRFLAVLANGHLVDVDSAEDYDTLAHCDCKFADPEAKAG